MLDQVLQQLLASGPLAAILGVALWKVWERWQAALMKIGELRTQHQADLEAKNREHIAVIEKLYEKQERFFELLREGNND